ncbi:hypothetical protein AK812_SmicGene39624 [Symbiodinium microadriaticum]|uniref:Uncharacterized protein n=1 Tax=Symbiodinium microadriaticum TaxID=2951 RepID=A0A1Q9CB28_SYMMI|nr:hypothetical protein AK812_SmicGene39624 [Symbiodinium microadriaticum]CAE7203110.1 unnamed protein product [Symbiodinium microadriaticum]
MEGRGSSNDGSSSEDFKDETESLEEPPCGSLVVLVGLRQVELNGLVGTVEEGGPEGRVAVRLGSGKSLAVRPGNLRLAEVDAFDADLDADDSPVAPSEDAGLRARKTGGCHCARSSFDPLNQYESRSASEATFEEEYARANKDLDEEPANLQQRKTWLSLIFLVLIVGPAMATFFITAKDWADPLVRVVPAGDSKQVQDIFFGGNAWLVSCVTSKTAATKPPSVLQAAAELLRPRGVRVARVHCWEPLETKKGLRSLAQRFGFREKPPVVMATRGQGSPTLLAATGLRAEALAAKVLAAVIPEESATVKAYTVREGSHGRSGNRVERVGKRPAEQTEEPTKDDAEVPPGHVDEEEEVNLDLD